MRKTVHLCLSSHDEIMYRNEADLIMGFNCLAIAALETGSRLLAEGFMPTHNHKLLQTDSIKEVARRERYSYSRYFNSKYYRKGRLGEKEGFCLEIDGILHHQSALNYVIRQGLHHGLSSTPFEYQHCSANAFFRKELGKDNCVPALIADEQRYKYLPHGIKVPASYRMTNSGLLLREDIIDTAYVEEIYITPRNFLFQMNKLSGEKDIREQESENKTPPVTIDRIEEGVPEFDVRKALIFEQGKVNKSQLTDLELCNLIDNTMLPQYCREKDSPSIYLLTERQRANMGNTIWQNKKLYPGKYTSVPQIRRCLAL